MTDNYKFLRTVLTLCTRVWTFLPLGNLPRCDFHLSSEYGLVNGCPFPVALLPHVWVTLPRQLEKQ